MWLLLVIGLIMAHATNNLLNDYTDHVRGVDKDNYFRAQYGPQPLEHGLMTTRQLLTYAAVTGLIALAAGAYLVYLRGTLAWVLLGAGAFFVLFYTWPLKYIGLGEVTVLLVWGPLMIGGGYFVITGQWDWNVVIASLPYTLGVTTVIFGKHIDKYGEDKTKHIHTLPVIIGERAARYSVVTMMVLQYLSVLYLVLTGFFTPIVLIVVFALPLFRMVLAVYRQTQARRSAGRLSSGRLAVMVRVVCVYQQLHRKPHAEQACLADRRQLRHDDHPCRRGSTRVDGDGCDDHQLRGDLGADVYRRVCYRWRRHSLR